MPFADLEGDQGVYKICNIYSKLFRKYASPPPPPMESLGQPPNQTENIFLNPRMIAVMFQRIKVT